MQNEELQTNARTNDAGQEQGDSPSENHIVTSDSVSGSKGRHWPTIPKKALLIAVALIAVAALGYGAYWYVIDEMHTTVTNGNQVITRLKWAIAHGTTSTTDGSTMPSYQPAGYTFPVKPLAAQSITFKVGSDKLPETYQKAQRILGLEGLTEKNVPDAKAGATPNTSYQNAFVHCSVIISQPTKDWAMQISCANNSAYATAAAQMKQFHDLYEANNPSVTGSVAVNQIDIQPSHTEGYKIAQAIVFYDNGTTGTPVSYYQTPDGTWHYFRASPEIPGCKDFNTPDLRKAYLGQTCYGNTLQLSKVNI